MPPKTAQGTAETDHAAVADVVQNPEQTWTGKLFAIDRSGSGVGRTTTVSSEPMSFLSGAAPLTSKSSPVSGAAACGAPPRSRRPAARALHLGRNQFAAGSDSIPKLGG